MIEQLHPAIRGKATEFIAKAKERGINLKITAGLRTFDEQQALYDQGRTIKGPIVTKAKPGQSFHNYGLAIDVVAIVNGKAVWDDDHLWKLIGAIGKEVGFEWGGDWKFTDKPHFQFPRAIKFDVLLALKNAGKVDSEGYVIL